MVVEGYSYNKVVKAFCVSIIVAILVAIIVYYFTSSIDLFWFSFVVLLSIIIVAFIKSLYYQFMLKRRGFSNLDKNSD
jgi:uncharacterized membrane protein